MFKIGDTVSKDDVYAAGWFIASFDEGLKDVVFVNEDDTMSVTFVGKSNIGVVEAYVCKELI